MDSDYQSNNVLNSFKKLNRASTSSVRTRSGIYSRELMEHSFKNLMISLRRTKMVNYMIGERLKRIVLKNYMSTRRKLYLS